MSDPRDDLAALIAETYDAHGEGSWDSAVSAADAILDRWQLVPRTPAARKTARSSWNGSPA